MKRSKASKKSLAEKALRAAIAEETSDLQAQLRQRDAEIARLHGLLVRISEIASTGGLAPLAQPVNRMAHALPEIVQPPIPEGPRVPLAGDDELGDGRWA